MYTKLKNLFLKLIDVVMPHRPDYEVVRRLNEQSLLSIPPAPPVEGMSWITSLFHYKDRRIKAVIWELKYRGNTIALGLMAKRMYEEMQAIISDTLLFDSDARFLLIPIPITPERRSERGYNQSEYICRAVVEQDLDHLLLYAPQWFGKIKNTASQSHTESRAERMKNLSGCFHVSGDVAGKYIFLVDDVVTTGSTLTEAHNTLQEAGARDVFGFTIAH